MEFLSSIGIICNAHLQRVLTALAQNRNPHCVHINRQSAITFLIQIDPVTHLASICYRDPKIYPAPNLTNTIPIESKSTSLALTRSALDSLLTKNYPIIGITTLSKFNHLGLYIPGLD
jgi:hypothetical protein